MLDLPQLRLMAIVCILKVTGLPSTSKIAISLMSNMSKPSIGDAESTPSMHHHEIKKSLLFILRANNSKNVSLRFVAIDADASGTSANFYFDLIKIVPRLDFGLDTYIDLAPSAQLNAVICRERFYECLKMVCIDNMAINYSKTSISRIISSVFT